MFAVELLLMAAVNVGSGVAIAAEMSIMGRQGVAAYPDRCGCWGSRSHSKPVCRCPRSRPRTLGHMHKHCCALCKYRSALACSCTHNESKP